MPQLVQKMTTPLLGGGEGVTTPLLGGGAACACTRVRGRVCVRVRVLCVCCACAVRVRVVRVRVYRVPQLVQKMTAPLQRRCGRDMGEM